MPRLPPDGLANEVRFSQPNKIRRGSAYMPQHQLPPVARNDFLHPIEADFGELKADWRNSHFTFVFQCYLGFCEGFFAESEAR